MIQSLLNVMIISLLTSCMSSEVQLTSPQGIGGRDLAGDKAVEVVSEGKKLWQMNCASCHTNPQSQQPTKYFATVGEINRAISSEMSMRHLDQLTEYQIEQISIFLNVEAIEDARARKSDQKAESRATLGNRTYVVSKLHAIYLSAAGTTANDNTLRSIINFISENAVAFGGACVANHETCVGVTADNYLAQMNANANVIRSGILTKVCREIHNNSTAITNVLDRLAIQSTDDLTDARLSKFIELYAPTIDLNSIPASLKQNLTNVFNDAVSNGTRIEGWNMLGYSLCDSVLFETN